MSRSCIRLVKRKYFKPTAEICLERVCIVLPTAVFFWESIDTHTCVFLVKRKYVCTQLFASYTENICTHGAVFSEIKCTHRFVNFLQRTAVNNCLYSFENVYFKDCMNVERHGDILR